MAALADVTVPANGGAKQLVKVVVKALVEEHAEAVVGTVVRMVAKETAEDHVLVHVEIRVQVDVQVTVGDRLAKVKDVGGVNPVFGTSLLFSINLRAMDTINKHYMKRISFIIALQIIFSISAFAQLNKFEGTWVKHDHSTWWNIYGEEGSYDKTTYLRIDIANDRVFIRQKIVNETMGKTTYCDVSDIAIMGDSAISYKRYYDPFKESMYIGMETHKTPNTQQIFDEIKQYRNVIIKLNRIGLDYSGSNVQFEFYKNGLLIDKSESEYHHRIDAVFYNEKDNW